jgi:hypothetical protein
MVNDIPEGKEECDAETDNPLGEPEREDDDESER